MWNVYVYVHPHTGPAFHIECGMRVQYAGAHLTCVCVCVCVCLVAVAVAAPANLLAFGAAKRR